MRPGRREKEFPRYAQSQKAENTGEVYPVASMKQIDPESSRLGLVRPAGIEPATLSLEETSDAVDPD